MSISSASASQSATFEQTRDFRSSVAVTDERWPVAVWLLACCGLVLLMVVIGGITRLTHSGLSITEWQPLVGTLPPLSAEQWNEVFQKYQATPEYQQVNNGMSLDQFKQIFWWEYFHRLFGRLIGVAFLLPLLWFIARRKLPPGLAAKLFGILLLGALQGAIGWYMVKSGLIDNPRVSHFRLTVHLGLAFLIFAAMFWLALSLLHPALVNHADGGNSLRGHSTASSALIVLIFVMVLTGGLVAGTRAGFAYNTFPLMDGDLLPRQLMAVKPWQLDFYHNLATVQFVHRLLAWLLAASVPIFWWRIQKSGVASARTRAGANLLLAMLVLQIVLGIITLLLTVPLPLAAAHQAGALLLFAAALNLRHALR